MKKFLLIFIVVISIVILACCTVTNNMYVNNATPQKKGESEGYFGVGTGFQPKIDSTPYDSLIYYNDKIKQSLILYFGGQYGLTDNLNVRLAVHLPKIVGGLGIRLGLQYSLFESKAPFNIAFGVDAGYVFARDSIKLGSSKFHFEDAKYANGAINGDFFIPLTIKPNDDLQIMLTPRYSINSMFVRSRLYSKKGKGHKISFPALTLGFKFKSFYFEASAAYYESKIYPLAGIAVVL